MDLNKRSGILSSQHLTTEDKEVLKVLKNDEAREVVAIKSEEQECTHNGVNIMRLPARHAYEVELENFAHFTIRRYSLLIKFRYKLRQV